MADVVTRLWGLGEIPNVAILPEPEGNSSLRSHPATGIPAGRDAKPLQPVLCALAGTPCCHSRGYIGFLPARRLDQPVAHAPLMLQQEQGAEFGKGVGSGIVEHPEDALAVSDRQSHELGVERECLLEDASCWLVDEPGELPDIVVGNPDAREHHSGDAMPARESASEEGSPSGTDSAPERSQCGPLLESCAAMPLATRRLDLRNDGLCVIDIAGRARPRVTKPLGRKDLRSSPAS
jgi:hypothetical protein